MAKLIIVFGSCLLGLCLALDDSKNARTLNENFETESTGPFKYSYATSDGVKKEESAVLQKSVHEDNSDVLVIKGSYSYTGADGVVYTVRYTADEAGFHPEGDHFKVPPFVPWVKGQPFDASGQYTEGSRVRNEYITTQRPTYLPPPVEPSGTNSYEYSYIPPKVPFQSGERIKDVYLPPTTSTVAPTYLPPHSPQQNNYQAKLDLRYQGQAGLPEHNNELFIPSSTPTSESKRVQFLHPSPFVPNQFATGALNNQIKQIIHNLAR